MAGTITVDTTSQTFNGNPQPKPDICLLHTTEGMGWPPYAGGNEAPHVTVKPFPGKGIEVRVHRPWTDYAKALANRPGGVETNRRGVLQLELMGTCDPSARSRMYFWPEADDVVLEALADYLRPVLARFDIPAVALAPFLPYPKSYGSAGGQRLTFAQWNTARGICGHQHAPENDHGDPGAFPIARFIQYLTQEDDMSDQDVQKVNDYTRALLLDGYTVGGVKKPSLLAVLAETQRRVTRTDAALTALATGLGPQVEEAVRKALSEEYDATVELTKKAGQ